MIEFASESAKKVFSVAQGQSFEEFSGANKIPEFPGSDPIFEIDISGEVVLSVTLGKR